jgi:hypothetical protein
VAPTAFLALFLPAVAPEFDTPVTYISAAACFLTALAYNLLLRRYPDTPAGAVQHDSTAGLASPALIGRKTSHEVKSQAASWRGGGKA